MRGRILRWSESEIKSQSQDIEGSGFAFDLWKPLQLVIKAIVIE